MLRAIALRLAGALPVLFLVTLVLFVLLRLAPGDAADLLVPDDAGEDEVARIRERWGLDQLGLIASYILLPALTLAFNMMGIIARITRSAIIDVAQEEFITTAVAKGLGRGRIIRDHLLPNAAVPIITIIGLELGVLIS